MNFSKSKEVKKFVVVGFIITKAMPVLDSSFESETSDLDIPLPQSVISILPQLRRLSSQNRMLLADVLQDEKAFQRLCNIHHPVQPPKKISIQSDLTFEHMFLRVPALFFPYLRLRDMGRLSMVSSEITRTVRVYFLTVF